VTVCRVREVEGEGGGGHPLAADVRPDPAAAPSRLAALEATQGQMDGFFSQLPYKCHLEEVASAGDDLRFALNSTPGRRERDKYPLAADVCSDPAAAPSRCSRSVLRPVRVN